MSEEYKTQKIEEINQKLSALKEQNARLNFEMKGWIEKRDKLNQQFRDLKSEILELKSERDKLNEKVKELKQQRDDARGRSQEIVAEMRKLSQKIIELNRRKPSKAYHTLQKEFEDIEWKIQTTSLGLQEEKKLVEQVKQLETELKIYKKLDQLKQKIVVLKAELKTLETEANVCHEKLTDIAQKSQGVHAKMLTKIDESNKIKIEADSSHTFYLQTKTKAKPIREEIMALSNQMKRIEKEIREKNEREKKRTEQALRKKLETHAEQKLKRGEKLTWNEFQLLAEKGTEAQD